MINLNFILIFSLCAILSFAHSFDAQDGSIHDYPFTLIAAGPEISESNICKIEVYNPWYDSWTIFAKVQLNATDNYTPFVSNGKIMIFGGTIDFNDALNEVVVYDIATKTTSYLPPMEKKKFKVGVAEVDGYIYVTGGLGSEYSIHDTNRYDLQEYDTVERYDPKANKWTTMTPMLTKRYSHAINTWEGKIYVAGGIKHDHFRAVILNSIEIYDPKLNKWTEGIPMQLHRFTFSIVFFDRALFAIGGNWTIDDCPLERFDLNTQKWSNISNTVGLTWKNAVVYNDKIMIGDALNKNYELNPKTNQIRQLNSKKIIRSSQSFLVPKTLVSQFPPKESTKSITDYPITIIALGPSEPETNICAIEFYHPLEDSWTLLENIKLNMNDGYSAIFSDKKLFIFGGALHKRGTEITYLDEAVSFDLVTKNISKLKQMSQKKKNVGVGKIGEYIYISGGFGYDDIIYDTVERYDPRNDSWTIITPMLIKRYNHAVNVWEEKMFVAGGNDGRYDNLFSLEIYDPKLNKWTLGTPMKSDRYKFSIIFMDGSLFAIGGIWKLGADDQKNHGERLDLKTQKWTNIANTIEDSRWQSAVAFNDKFILYGDVNHNYEYNPKTNALIELNPNKIKRSYAMLLLASMI